jgi:heterodisulfide reductase subunit B
MKTTTYYPGCSLHSTGIEYQLSTQAIFTALGMEMAEAKDWNCCGATPAHSAGNFLSHALPLRNLIIAEQTGEQVILPCAACYNVFRRTHHFMQQATPEAEEVNREVAEIVGTKYQGKLAVRHLLEVFTEEDMLNKFKFSSLKPLRGLKLATYYGCLLVRPAEEVAFDDPEQPRKLDMLVESLGAEAVPWSYKTDCCGGSMAIPRPEIVTQMANNLVEAARRAGAEAIVTACPLCQANLDTRQNSVQKALPVLYFTELMAAALNLPNQEKWLRKHIVDPGNLLSR